MEQTYLVDIGDARLNPQHVAAVWIYTMGDVCLNVRADGMTFKETFCVDRETGQELDGDGNPTQAWADELMRRYKVAQTTANQKMDAILVGMFAVLNPTQ